MSGRTDMTTAVRERPILFSGPMVRAILDGRKTQTRRVLKAPRWAKDAAFECEFDSLSGVIGSKPWPWVNRRDGMGWWKTECPYGQPGDRLWARETWNALMEWPTAPGETGDRWWQDMPAAFRGTDSLDYLAYAADQSTHYYVEVEGEGASIMSSEETLELPPRWCPSIHMPRWASRLTFEITDVRVERVQDISEDDAKAEGVEGVEPGELFFNYQTLWDSLNAKRGYGWTLNPWVWVVAFRQVTP